jgi:hypothetical protein
MNASQPGLQPEGVFNGILYFKANPWPTFKIDFKLSAATAHTTMALERSTELNNFTI